MKALFFHGIMFFHGIIILMILLLAFSPLLGVVWVGAVANANGCQVDEGSVHPCIVNGKDIGQTLYSVGVLGWLMLVTVPAGLLLVGVYLVGLIIFYLVKRRRQPNAGAAG